MSPATRLAAAPRLSGRNGAARAVAKMDRDHKIRIALRGFEGEERERRKMNLLQFPERIDDAMGQRLQNEPSKARAGRGSYQQRCSAQGQKVVCISSHVRAEEYLKLRFEAAQAKMSLSRFIRSRVLRRKEK